MKWEFTTTSWSQVLAVRDGSPTESAQLLETLYQAYWYLLYAFVRLPGTDPSQAGKKVPTWR